MFPNGFRAGINLVISIISGKDVNYDKKGRDSYVCGSVVNLYGK